MEDLREQYEKVLKNKFDTIHKINELAKDVKVKKYLGLSTKRDGLIKKENELYEKIKLEEYNNCKHVVICSGIENKSYYYYACIKCGLNSRAFVYRNMECQPQNERIMIKYFDDKQFLFSVDDASVICEIGLANAIYNKIKEAHPDIDDVTALKYFEIALDNIRNIKVSEERRKSRAKRLSLGSNFNSWYSEDVCD